MNTNGHELATLDEAFNTQRTVFSPPFGKLPKPNSFAFLLHIAERRNLSKTPGAVGARRARWLVEVSAYQILMVTVVLLATPARSATVTTTADSGPGSLRDAIVHAAPGEAIDFSVNGAIALTSGELTVNKNLTISGPGAVNLTIRRSAVSGTPDFRIFNIASGIVTISALTVSNGVSGNAIIAGAGTAGSGVAQGGGIFLSGLASFAVITNSTVASNSIPAAGTGGGLFNFGRVVLITNTILAGNLTGASVDFFSGPSGDIESGFNLIGSSSGPIVPGPGDQFDVTGAALRLAPLQDNGGPTFTHALLCGSPAIDAGDNLDAPATDQRGFPRVVRGVIDIGAYEDSNTAPSINCPAPMTLNSASPTGQAATLSVNVADVDGDPLFVVWTVDGTPNQTNAVASGGPPTTARVDFTAFFAIGSHQVAASVSDSRDCVAICSTTITVTRTSPLSSMRSRTCRPGIYTIPLENSLGNRVPWQMPMRCSFPRCRRIGSLG